MNSIYALLLGNFKPLIRRLIPKLIQKYSEIVMFYPANLDSDYSDIAYRYDGVFRVNSSLSRYLNNNASPRILVVYGCGYGWIAVVECIDSIATDVPKFIRSLVSFGYELIASASSAKVLSKTSDVFNLFVVSREAVADICSTLNLHPKPIDDKKVLVIEKKQRKLGLKVSFCVV